MLKRLLTGERFPLHLAWFGLMLMVVSLCTTRALLSNSMGVLAVAGLLQYLFHKESRRKLADWRVWGLSLLFFISCITFFWTEDKVNWARDITVKLPFLILPPVFALLPPFNRKQLASIGMAFLLIVSLIAAGSVIAFFLNYEEISLRVDKNDSIEIISNISHIYFGLIMAFSVFLAVAMFRQRLVVFFQWEKWLYLLFALTNAIALHILTSRTGLLAFYGGILTYIVWIVLSRRAWLKGAGLMLLLVLIPLFAYQFSHSFRQRLHVSRWDIEQYRQGNFGCNCSITQRLLVWGVCMDLIRDNPVLGVGFGDIKEEVWQKYKGMGFPKNMPGLILGPHNQWLEQWAGGGLPAIAVLAFVMFSPFFNRKLKRNPLYLTFIVMVILSFLTESLLERQIGIAFFLVAYCLLERDEAQFFLRSGKSSVVL
jgi:O-antigen ligase